ncbi:endonuclease/exonuclease/phosphatase family protein [Priestia endophytica]|uniref:endonuclease/exonuclease/phosphatase family protein n=1 Tax=Priestia endophytica TaxID=135735 RepID=UPI000DCA3736|nr:endonuclease/exonuclease/phosphatase family protein [Priestia endophytica]RAS75420.1 endonuclease [Priestia endophytica]
MKLLTLNCHSWQEDNQLDKLALLAKKISNEEYDVIALQEVSQHKDSAFIYENVREDNYAFLLKKELERIKKKHYEFIWDLSHIGYSVFEEGVALLTRHPVKEWFSFFISKSEDQNFWKTRKVVGARISYNGENVAFYSCHLGWWDDEEEPFQSQVDTLLANVKREKVFYLMGDFNNDASIKGEGYDYLLSQGLYDLYNQAEEKDHGITVEGKIDGWSQNTQNLRLDLILSNVSIQPRCSKTVFNGTEQPSVSDHFGVEVKM